MPPKKTPTSSLSAIELLVRRVWHRSQAGIHRMRFPALSTIHTSSTTKLPQEIVEMIIAHLTCDTCSLRSCSLTCHSWYIAVVPHLHYTLYTTRDSWDRKSGWPNPLQHMYRLGLIPFVRTLLIRMDGKSDTFSSKQFNNRTLRQFSALSNVRLLTIDRLDIPSFMPRIRQYFGHFSPTVRGLSLRAPHGTRRQIIYFIGLFEHLQDLGIDGDGGDPHDEPEDDLTLTPLFTPPLRGRLKLISFGRVGLVRDMIDLFGGFRFHVLDIFSVDGVPLLLDACAKSLTTLHLYPCDFRATSSPRDFDLSRCKSLRTIKVMAWSMDSTLMAVSSDAASIFFNYALSTIMTPSFFQVVVVYLWHDFRGVETCLRPGVPLMRELSQADIETETSHHRRRFGVLREARKVRDFRLVLSVEVWGPVMEYSVRMLNQAVAEEKARNRPDDFLRHALITCHPRRSRTIDHGEVGYDE